MMEDLCTGCLCSGRKMVLLHETDYYHIYSQILNEIPVYDLSSVVIKICWECRAVLRRIQEFKQLIKISYISLMQGTACPVTPRLSTHVIEAHVKNEVPFESDIKSEPDIDDDVNGATFADQLSFEHDDDDDDNYEPEENPKKKLKINKTNKKIKKKKKKRKKVNKNNIDEINTPQDEQNILQDEHIVLQDEKTTDNNTIKENNVDNVAKLSKTQRAKCEQDIEPATLDDKPKCEECGKMFSSKKTYRYHINVLHKGNNKYPCPRCGKVYQWKSNLGRHMRTHKAVDAGELYCALCDKSFASVATYRQHLSISRRHVTENEYTFVCNECGKRFVNKTRLRDHIDWEHLKKIKFKCQLCNKAFKCHTSLYVHTQNVHRDKDKKDNLCHVCGKSYQNAAKLKYHITAMHSGASPYRCGECGAAFGWYSSLYRHLRELHYKMKVQPKKTKKAKKIPETLPPMLPPHYPMQPPG